MGYINTEDARHHTLLKIWSPFKFLDCPRIHSYNKTLPLCTNFLSARILDNHPWVGYRRRMMILARFPLPPVTSASSADPPAPETVIMATAAPHGRWSGRSAIPRKWSLGNSFANARKLSRSSRTALEGNQMLILYLVGIDCVFRLLVSSCFFF